MPAFDKVPVQMRQRLALLTGNQTRLIGGSSDTVYIPSESYGPSKNNSNTNGAKKDRLLPEFLEVLALFLDTNCFLEIALPTTLHLILPPNETISYVDHVCSAFFFFINGVKTDGVYRFQWWIWKPPFNVSFVHQKWAQGFEVDSFHT